MMIGVVSGSKIQQTAEKTQASLEKMANKQTEKKKMPSLGTALVIICVTIF